MIALVALVSLGANAFAFGHHPAAHDAVTEARPPVLAPRAHTLAPPRRAPTAHAPDATTAPTLPTATSRPEPTAKPTFARARAPLPSPVVTTEVAPPPIVPPVPADLESAMRLAAGPSSAAVAAPSGTLPRSAQLRPAQGAIVAALRDGRESARSCLGEGDEPRVVAVVFESRGTVARVETATNDAKDGCIAAALRRARVEPFDDPTFRARFTVRAR